MMMVLRLVKPAIINVPVAMEKLLIVLHALLDVFHHQNANAHRQNIRLGLHCALHVMLINVLPVILMTTTV